MVISHLVRTKFWVQFLGILGIIGSAIGILVVLGLMIAGASTVSSMFPGARLSGAALIGGGAFYLLFLVIPLYISIKLFGYGSAIGQLRYSGQVQHLELALDRQRTVWKAYGIITMLMMALWLVAVLGAMAFGFSMARQVPSRGSLLPNPSGSIEEDP